MDYNFEIKKGISFVRELIYKDDQDNPIDLTDMDVKMQIRSDINSPNILVELSTQNQKIVTVPNEGKITFSIHPDDTKNITTTKAVYDLILISGDFRECLIEGTIIFTSNVTK
jgi:hypothetical protein